MKKIVVLTGLFVFYMLCPAYSQSSDRQAYIVKAGNDTIYGIGKIDRVEKKFHFKPEGNNDFSVIGADSVKVFRFCNGAYYVPKQITDKGESKTLFLECLVEGDPNLYHYNFGHSRFFVEKDNKLFELEDGIYHKIVREGKTYLQHDKKYLGYLLLYMADVPELKKRIKRMKRLNEKKLTGLFEDYHKRKCPDSNCVYYIKEFPTTSLKVELVGGVSRRNAYYSPRAGAILYFSRPPLHENLFFRIGLFYTESTYSYKTQYEDRQVSNHLPQLDMSILYAFSKNKFQPIVALGTSLGDPILFNTVHAGFLYSFTHSMQLNFEASLDGLFSFVAQEHTTLYDTPLGHSINLGLVYRFK